MKPSSIRSLPRVMPLARAAKEILALDTHEVYRLAREGKVPGAFKVGKLWFVAVVTMIHEPCYARPHDGSLIEEPEAEPRHELASQAHAHEGKGEQQDLPGWRSGSHGMILLGAERSSRHCVGPRAGLASACVRP